MVVSINPIALDQAERDILIKTGMPLVFAQFLKEKSHALGIAFALRASSPMQRYLMPAAPKPVSVKAKTGNWSFTKGVITVDPQLGKTEKIDGQWRLVERSAHDFPKKNSGILSEVIHRLSLQEILAALHSGEYTHIGSGEDIHDSGTLILRPNFRFPADSHYVFRINFNEKAARLEKQLPIDFSKILISIPSRAEKPVWWNDKWGNFTDCLDNYYPAQYMNDDENEFKDIIIYGVNDGSGKVLPITGDQDLMWISIPTSKHENFLKDFDEVYNTFDREGLQKLYAARVALHLRLGGKPEDIAHTINNSSLAGMGCVTAYESHIIDEINLSFANCGIRHLRNLIQHAAENHTPVTPSPLDTNMIHIWHGKLSMTHNENEMIRYVMQKDYPNENIFSVHHKWDMVKWAPVIAMQLSLNQPVPIDTLTEYKQYRATAKPHKMFSLTSWIKK